MKSVLIIGASRGLGLEFVRQYRHDGWLTLGTCRSPEQDALLTAVGATALRLDVADENGFANLGKALAGRSIDVCIYNAGISGPRSPNVVAPEADEFDAVMHANVLGALRAIPVVAPALARASGTFAFISSRMGSIGLMAGSGSVTYRASKAALNAVVKAAALEWGPKGVTCVTFHPGWVKTDMGGANAPLAVEDSVRALIEFIDRLAPEHYGGFFSSDGRRLPW